MACFLCDLHTHICDEDYPCDHYFFWRLSIWTLPLCSITHYDMTMDNDVRLSQVVGEGANGTIIVVGQQLLYLLYLYTKYIVSEADNAIEVVNYGNVLP